MLIILRLLKQMLIHVISIAKVIRICIIVDVIVRIIFMFFSIFFRIFSSICIENAGTLAIREDNCFVDTAICRCYHVILSFWWCGTEIFLVYIRIHIQWSAWNSFISASLLDRLRLLIDQLTLPWFVLPSISDLFHYSLQFVTLLLNKIEFNLFEQTHKPFIHFFCFFGFFSNEIRCFFLQVAHS